MNDRLQRENRLSAFQAINLRNRIAALIAGVAVAGLGAITLAGWVLHHEALKNIIPGSVTALKPNVALGMLFCGATLSLLTRKRLTNPFRICAAVMAGAVVTLCALTVVEYFLSWDLKIDHWLIGNAAIDAENPNPGRMTPITAVCFGLAAAALFTAAGRIQKESRLTLVAGLSGILIGAGGVPLIGYFLEMLFGAGWNFMGMETSSILPALAFLFLGTGLLVLLRANGHLIWALGRLTTTGIAFGFVSMMLAGGLVYNFSLKVQEAATRVSHSQDVLTEIEEIESAILTLENQQQGYIITDNERLLEEWDDSESAIREHFQKLQRLAVDNPSQGKRIRQLADLVSQRVGRAKEAVQARREGGFLVAQEFVARGATYALWVQSQEVIEELEKGEHFRLDERESDSAFSSQRAFLMLPLGIFICMAVLSIGLFFLNAGTGERKGAERSLYQSEEGMRAILDSALDCIITMNHCGQVVEFNPAAEETFGYRREEAIGQLLSELIIPPALRERHQQGLARYLATGQGPALGQRLELTAVRHDGSEFPIELAIIRIGTQEPPMFTGFIRDITERKEAHDALRQAEEKYRSIFENAVEGIYQTTPSGEFLAINPAAARILGFSSPDQVRGMSAANRSFGYVDRRRLGEFMRLIEERGVVNGFESEIYRPDGSRVWISENVRVRYGSSREILYFEGTLQDITKARLAEQVRETSQQRLHFLNDFGDVTRSLSQSKEVMAAVTRLLGTHLRVSRCAYAEVENDVNHFTVIADHTDGCDSIVGQHRLSDFGQHLLSELAAGRMVVLRDVDAEPAAAGAAAAYQAINVKAMIACPIVKKGALVAALGVHHLAPRNWTNGEILLVQEAAERCWSIIERARAEQKLTEQANLLNLAQDAIMVRDMGDRIEFWNHGAEALYGWTAEEVRGHPNDDFLGYEEPVKILAERILLETGAWSGECSHLTKDGKKVVVRSRWTLVRDEHGHPKSKLIIATDMTEQKKIEEQFLRAQRLESIGTLASGVAHDLNNILVPIMMAAPVLRGEMDPEEREKFLDIVEASARRGADIIKQVLTFARGADGERTLLQPIYLLEEVSKIASQTFPKSITLRTCYDENICSLEADPTQLHQILLNLCINARDAMPNGGELCLGAENFDVDEHYASMTPGATAGPHVMLQVTDTGSGIPKQVIEKIFDPFFTTKDVGQGTGLGLSTVAGIVRSHGGFIHVYSEPGHTSFKVFLPAKTTADPANALPAKTLIPRGRGETILLVDDEPNIRQIAEVILKAHGYKVLLAEDGPSALALFAGQMNQVAVVVTDLAMPGMDGLLLVRTLRQIRPGCKVIVSTGRTDNSNAAEITALNVDGCLTKPYTKSNLLLKLSHVLDSRLPAAA